jgi:dethiobiotin synthetase
VTTTVFVTGTGTEIGKTWWSVALIRELRARGVVAAARKPAQSFRPGDGATDAELLAEASGIDPTLVCPPPRWYELPLAPPMAAAALGRPGFTISDLVAETSSAADRLTESNLPVRIRRVLLVEGAGGPRSPLADDGDNVDFARALGVDLVLLVADAGLGTINAVRLAAAPFREIGVPLVVALNRFGGDPLHAVNEAWLRDRYGFDTVTDPDLLADGVVADRWATGSVVESTPKPGKHPGQ